MAEAAINGELFVDKALGVTVLTLNLILVGTAIYFAITDPKVPALAHATKIFWLVTIATAAIAVMRSSVKSMTLAAALFAARLAYDILYTVPHSPPKDRVAPLAVLFSLGMLIYALFRRKALLSSVI
jgi:hypothetical protein